MTVIGGADPSAAAGEGAAALPAAREPSLLASSASMAAGTIVSRLTGFVRSLTLIWALGDALFGDTFNLANTVPTSLYILVAGGALNAVFVPQLVRAMKRDPDGGQAFGQRLLTVTAALLVGFTALVVAFAPWVVRIYASSALLAPQNRAYFDLAVSFARYCLPQVVFYGLFVLFGQVLNARGRFGPMMWAPVLNNIVSIVVFATFIVASNANSPGTITPGEKAWLGIGSTVGIAVQTLVLIPIMARTGFRIRLRFDLRGGGLGKSGRLAAWTIGFVLVNQVWFFVSTRLTTGAGIAAEHRFGGDVGYGLTPFLNAFTISQLPHAVIAVSIVTALLPRMSRAAADGAVGRVRADLSHGLRLTVAAIAPAAVAFFALGPVLTVAMFDHFDRMNAAAAQVIGYMLMGFSIGLVGFSSQYLTLRGFYAYEDTRTPMFNQMVSVGVSVALAIVAYAVLPLQWKTVGIAVANSLGWWAGFAVNVVVLRGRLGRVDGFRITRTYVRVGLASVVAGAAGYGVAHATTGLLGAGAAQAVAASVLGGGVLVAGYLALARLLRIREVTDVVTLALSRLRPRHGQAH